LNLPHRSWEGNAIKFQCYLSVGGAKPPGLHSNATPHQTLAYLEYLAIRFFIVVTSEIETRAAIAIAETFTTPPIEIAAETNSVALTPKLYDQN
jgi:hypothetical protein